MKKIQVGPMHSAQMLMNVVLGYMIVTKKLNVPILKDHIAVNVSEVLLVMENILVQERKFSLLSFEKKTFLYKTKLNL